MVAQYTAMVNQDIEKQILQEQEQQQCPCISSHQNENQTKKYSKLKYITLGAIGLFFIAHAFGPPSYLYQHHEHYHHENNVPSHEETNIKMSSLSSLSSSLNDIVHLNGVVSDCSEENLQPWEGKKVYSIPKSIQHFQFGETAKNTVINLKEGNINVVENKDLDETRVTLDIKLNNETPEDFIRIEEENTEDSYHLSIIHDSPVKKDNTCIQINALIEVPSSDALSSLILRFISDEINIKNAFEFNDQLELATISGNIHSDKLLKATNVKLSNVGGNIQGLFDLNQNGEFKADTISGQADITFDHISSDSVITSSTVSGQTNFEMPSDFDSQFELITNFGEVNVEATNNNLLHYKKSNHFFEKSIKGKYGEDENPTSKITSKAVSGEINLNYR